MVGLVCLLMILLCWRDSAAVDRALEVAKMKESEVEMDFGGDGGSGGEDTRFITVLN